MDEFTRKFLFAEGPGHMNGRRINEGTISVIPNNTRFGASLRSYECRLTGRQYKSVFVRRNINLDEEILTYYGSKTKWTYPKSKATTSTTPTSTESDDG